MKNIFLFVYMFLVAGFSGFSQSLSLSNQFGPIVPNSTIIQAGTPDSNTLLTYIHVKNTSGSPVNVLCKKAELSLLDSTQTYMCWANFCYAPHILISPNAVSVGAGETYSGFKAIYAQMAYNNFFVGESVVRWVFFNQEDVNDSASVTVRYQTFPVGIVDVNASETVLLNVFPNPASRHARFDYAVPAGSAGVILIQNLRGVTVQTHALPANDGNTTVDITNLVNGIYICSLLIDGKRTQTKKLIVNH